MAVQEYLAFCVHRICTVPLLQYIGTGTPSFLKSIWSGFTEMERLIESRAPSFTAGITNAMMHCSASCLGIASSNRRPYNAVLL